MSSGRLTAAMADLGATLAKVPALGQPATSLPLRVTPPLTLVKPAEPWVTTAGCPSRQGDVHAQVVLIARNGADADGAVTAMVEDALDALYDPASDWTVSTVSEPYDLQVGDVTHVAARLEVTRTAHLTTD